VRTGETFRGADPKRSIARGQQAEDSVGRERLAGRCLPRCGSDAIETEQPKFCPEPQVAVWRLGDATDHAFDKAIADLPRHVGVLADIDGERTGTRQQNAGECRGRRESATLNSTSLRSDDHIAIPIYPLMLSLTSDTPEIRGIHP